mgnify:FL=1
MMKSFVQILVSTVLVTVITGFYAKDAKAHQLGPTGLQGKTSAKNITITKVAEGSPADGKLEKGDVIVGAGKTRFQSNARREIAAAIDQAETEKAQGILPLTLKDGKTVDLQLKVLGSYSDTAPYDCPKTDAIIKRAADHLVETGKYADRLCLGWLGLMATGEEKYINLVKEKLPKQDWANPKAEDLWAVLRGANDAGYVGWYWGYRLIALAEYHLLTGDDSVLPAIKAYAVALAEGQDAGGLWGHRMASVHRNGRLPGYAQINQTSLTCFMGMLLARKCGIDDPALIRAIEKTHDFYASFIGRGAFNYGVHGPNTRTYNNNGTSGSGALVMALKGNTEGATFFSKLAATSYDGLETGHATHIFNILWTPLGANVAGPEITQQFFERSRWLHTLYRAWDGRFTFDGGNSKAVNNTGVHLLAYCIPRQALYITGKKADQSVWLKGEKATDAIELSKIDYKSMSADELMGLLGHPIPQVTRRANWTLREKDDDVLPELVKMMTHGTKIERRKAVGHFGWKYPKEKVMPLMDTIGKVLRDTTENPWVRAAAASSLSWLGEPAYKYYNDMVKLVVEEEPGDIFGDVDWSVATSMQRLCKTPFEAGLVTNKPMFYTAARKLLKNKRQHVRASGARMLAGMPLNDFYIVADEVMHVIQNDDPTYHSYHNSGAVGAAIEVLAQLNVDGGIQYAFDVLESPSGKYGFKARMTMSVLAKYGAHAKDHLKMVKGLNRGKFARQARATIKAIEQDENPGKLISFEEAINAGLTQQK